jgi:hypothetical protein
VLTSAGGSYAVCHDGTFYYLFDSHGGMPPNEDVATFRRTADRNLFRQYIVTDVVGNSAAEFSCVLFEKKR